MSVRYAYVPENSIPRWVWVALAITGLLGLAVAAAAATDLWVFDDGPGLASFLADDRATVYVVDNSLSVAQNGHVAFLAEQVESIGVESKENSQVALILFGSESDQVIALDSVQAEEWREASKQVNGSMGETNLFSAARHGLAILEPVAPGVARKLVIITDGQTQNVDLMPAVVETATDLGVSVDTIVLGDANSVVLETLSDSTGGTFQVWDDLSIIAN